LSHRVAKRYYTAHNSLDKGNENNRVFSQSLFSYVDNLSVPWIKTAKQKQPLTASPHGQFNRTGKPQKLIYNKTVINPISEMQAFVMQMKSFQGQLSAAQSKLIR